MSRLLPLFGIALVPLLASLGVAFAKGGPGAQSVTLSADRVRTAAGMYSTVNLGVGCLRPLDAQCSDPSYADTTCGQYFASRISAGNETACQAKCTSNLIVTSLCLNEEWLGTLCGRHEARLMALPGSPANHPSRCVRLLDARNRNLQQADGTLFPTAVTGPVIVPSTLRSGTGSPPLPVGSRATVRLPTYAPRIVASGGDSTVHGQRAREQIRLSNPDDRSTAELARDLVRGAWEANEDRVESCEEYQFEKYYDYNLFEDAIAPLGNEHRAIFDVAYANPELGMNAPRSALGTRGIANVAQAQRDGTTLSPQVFEPITGQPKNIYFSLGVPSNEDRAEIIAAWEATPDSNEDKTVRPMALGSLVLLDEDLHARLLTGQPTHTDHWAYHRTMSNALLPNYLDEELYRLDEVKRRYERLLRRRAEYLATMAGIVEDIVRDNAVLDVEDVLGLPFDPADIVSLAGDRVVYDPYRQSFQIQDQVRASYAETIATTIDFNAGALFDGENLGVPRSNLHGGQRSFQAQTSGGAQRFGFGFGGPSNVSTTAPKKVLAGDPLTGCLEGSDYPSLWRCLVHAIAVTDGELEEELKIARDLACLDAGIQACDWSPAHFTQRLHDPYTAYREPEYQRCAKYTAERGFDALRNATFRYDLGGGQVLQPTVDGRLCQDGDYTVSPTELERYTHCLDRLRHDLVEYLTQVTGSSSIISPDPPYRVEIGGNASDYVDRGNGRFRSSVDYDGTWALTNLPTNVNSPDYCEVEPSFYGQVALGGTANRKSSSFFKAEASLSRTPGVTSKGVIEVLGNEIVGVEGQLGGGNFNIIQDSDFETQTFVEARATIVVVVVPVTFRAGITGVVGASIALGAGAPAGTSGGCSQGHIGLAGDFRPTAGVRGYMSAALDVLIVEAGVKGVIELVTLELPTKLELTLEGAQVNGRVEPQMTVRTNMDLVLSSLRGRISAFVEVCFILCERFEETIFRWDGLRFTSNLFKHEFEVPLGPLVDYNANL